MSQLAHRERSTRMDTMDLGEIRLVANHERGTFRFETSFDGGDFASVVIQLSHLLSSACLTCPLL